jgi:hypothetical protein
MMILHKKKWKEKIVKRRDPCNFRIQVQGRPHQYPLLQIKRQQGLIVNKPTTNHRQFSCSSSI